MTVAETPGMPRRWRVASSSACSRSPIGAVVRRGLVRGGPAATGEPGVGAGGEAGAADADAGEAANEAEAAGVGGAPVEPAATSGTRLRETTAAAATPAQLASAMQRRIASARLAKRRSG